MNIDLKMHTKVLEGPELFVYSTLMANLLTQPEKNDQVHNSKAIFIIL